MDEGSCLFHNCHLVISSRDGFFWSRAVSGRPRLGLRLVRRAVVRRPGGWSIDGRRGSSRTMNTSVPPPTGPAGNGSAAVAGVNTIRKAGRSRMPLLGGKETEDPQLAIGLDTITESRTETRCPGNDGPLYLPKRMHSGEESPDVGTQFTVVLLPRQRPGGVEFVGGRVDVHPDWRGHRRILPRSERPHRAAAG